MKRTDAQIIVEQLFNTSPEFLWKALTEIGEMRKWYFSNIPDFKPVVGFKTEFNIQSAERNFLHKWEEKEVEPFIKIKYNWEFENYTGKSSTTFKLSRHNDFTKLKLIVDVLEDFQEDVPEFNRESCIGGWNYFINNRLVEYFK